jgi:hypothetical protein
MEAQCLNIPSNSCGLADEKKSFDGMEMIRSNRIDRFSCSQQGIIFLCQNNFGT